MKRLATFAAVALAACLMGCESTGNSTTMPATTQASLGAVQMCACGAYKGTDMCCNSDLPRCDGCGKIKGSPGCCK